MADTIKGLTVKIGADTSDFSKELKKVDKEINTTQKTANALQKGLKLEFDSTRFEQAQKKVQKALDITNEKAKAIKEQLKYLESTGGIDTDGYNKLQEELAKTETQALQLNNQLKELDQIKTDNAYASINKLSSSLQTAADKTKILSTASAAAIVGIVKLASDAVNSADDIQTTADQYNLSAEAIQKWNYIALQSDVASDTLYKSMTKARDAVGTALTDSTNTATTALTALGLDISQIPTDTEGAFTTIINALAQVEDSTLQAYYANEIFGERIATNLIPLLNQGADGIQAYIDEFSQVGYLSNEQISSLADFDNVMNEINTKVDNAKTKLGLALLPVYEELANLLEDVVVPAIQKLAQWFDNLGEDGQKVVLIGLSIVAALSPVLSIFSKVTKAIPSIVNGFKSFTTAANGLYLKLGLIAAAMGTIFDLIGNWKQMSTVEKILKTLAVAALVAAAAITVFHASWSLGIAIGAITAGIVAGIAAIKAASEDIGVDAGIGDNDISSGSTSTDYSIPTTSQSSNNVSEDNSQYNITINLTGTGNNEQDAKSLASEIIRQIQIQKQAGA